MLFSVRNLILCVFLPLVLVSLLQHGYYWTQLPDRVATHFGADGQPNDWMQKTSACVVLGACQIIVPLIVLGATTLANRLPSSMVNIPHREYWLHADRRAETLAWMNRMMTWIAILSLIFMMAISRLTFVANMRQGSLDLRWFLMLLGGYLTIIFIMAGRSLIRFGRPPKGAISN